MATVKLVRHSFRRNWFGGLLLSCRPPGCCERSFSTDTCCHVPINQLLLCLPKRACRNEPHPIIACICREATRRDFQAGEIAPSFACSSRPPLWCVMGSSSSSSSSSANAVRRGTQLDLRDRAVLLARAFVFEGATASGVLLVSRVASVGWLPDVVRSSSAERRGALCTTPANTKSAAAPNVHTAVTLDTAEKWDTTPTGTGRRGGVNSQEASDNAEPGNWPSKGSNCTARVGHQPGIGHAVFFVRSGVHFCPLSQLI